MKLPMCMVNSWAKGNLCYFYTVPKVAKYYFVSLLFFFEEFVGKQKHEIKFFIILAVLRPNVQRVRANNLQVIAPAGKTASLEMLRRWRAVGNTVSNFTGPKFKPQTSRYRDGRVTARPTWWL